MFAKRKQALNEAVPTDKFLAMTTTLKAHFDGKVIVPDEAVELPLNTALRVEVAPVDAELAAFEESRRRVLALARNISCGIGPRNWTREDLYER